MKTEQIKQELKQIEREENVGILYAVESGSRAWGFESPDSDYDVRFIYARSAADYLKVAPMRDVIKKMLPGDLDVSGWDIYKALRLFRASNPPLLEWLPSPIIYRKSGDFAQTLRDLARTSFSPRRTAYHYVSMARKNYAVNIANKDAVTLKKYLYVIRPLFCMQWLEKHGTPPPTLFSDVRTGIELASEIEDILNDLLAEKQEAKETEKSPPYLALNTYLQMKIEWAQTVYETLPNQYFGRVENDLLDALTLHVLNAG